MTLGQRKRKERTERAKLLRGYRKAMKAEVYDAGSGGNRKRARGTEDQECDYASQMILDKHENKKSAKAECSIKSSTEGRKKRKKVDMFAKAKIKANEKQTEREQIQLEREQERKNIEKNVLNAKKGRSS